MLLHKIGLCTVTYQMYGCNLAVGKVDEHTKLCLSSLTKKIIRYYTFLEAVGKKKQSVETESSAFAGQRETTNHEEKERQDRPWIFFLVFFCSSNMSVHLFRLHRFVSGVGLFFFRSSPQNGTTTFDSLHIVLPSIHWCRNLVTSPSQ